MKEGILDFFIFLEINLFLFLLNFFVELLLLYHSISQIIGFIGLCVYVCVWGGGAISSMPWRQ